MKFLSVRGVCDYAGPGSDSRYRRRRCCLPQPRQSRRSRIKLSRSSIPGPPMPLFTLHVPPRHSPRKTRGQDGFAISFPAGLFHPLLHAGLTRRTEAQLWTFVGSQRMLKDNDAPEIHWVAAESLDAALRYMRQRYDDFIITDARFLDMIPLLSGSPLD